MIKYLLLTLLLSALACQTFVNKEDIVSIPNACVVKVMFRQLC